MRAQGDSLDRQTELSDCTFVKTVLMLSIVFYHSLIFWRGGWNVVGVAPTQSAAGIYWLVQWLAACQNYAFALASGYLFYYVKYERGGYGHFGSFLCNKAKRLLVPFLFVGAAWVIPVSCLYLKQDLWQTVVDYLLVKDAGQIWFLVMLFGVFLLFWPLSDFFAKHHWAGALAMLGIYASRFIGGRFLPNYFSIWNVTKFLAVFWIGFKLRQGTLDFIRKIPLWLWIAGYTALMLLYEINLSAYGVLGVLVSYGVEFAVHAVGAVMAFFALQWLAKKVRWKENNIFGFFAKHSMVIYLFHQQIIYFTIRELNGLLNPYVHAMVNFVCATIISAAISALIMRFRATRAFVGEK